MQLCNFAIFAIKCLQDCCGTPVVSDIDFEILANEHILFHKFVLNIYNF